MDIDDQDLLVHSLEDQAFQQTKDFQRYFGLVVGFAVLVSLVYPLLCQEECSTQWAACWIHAAVSSLTHALSILLSRKDPPSSRDLPLLLATSVPTVIAVLLWLAGKFAEDIEVFHLGLILGNIVSFMGSLLLRWDIQSTKTALEELHGAKYEHKSL
jgi:hypothetical protein